MIVLFHGDYPRHIVECDCAKTKVRVVRDLLGFLHEAVEVMSLEDLFRGLSGGDHNSWVIAKLKKHNRAIFLGKLP